MSNPTLQTRFCRTAHDDLVLLKIHASPADVGCFTNAESLVGEEADEIRAAFCKTASAGLDFLDELFELVKFRKL